MKNENIRKDDKPWYREPWPWILMAGPAIVVVAGLCTAWLAVKSSDGLVEDDYYRQGLAVNQRMARIRQAEEHGISADLVAGGSGGRDLRLFLDSTDKSAMPEKLLLRLVHPTRSGGDQSVELLRETGGAAGFFVGRLATPVSGRWHVQIEDDRHQWRLVADWIVERQPALHLGAAKAADVSAER